MSIPVYIINLDRSKDRFKAVALSAEKAHLNYRRVPAVDGKTVDINSDPRIDEKGFRRRHGKLILPGEAGCYLSHLNALSMIAAGADPYAVIVEDDVAFKDNFLNIITAFTDITGWDIIKLVNHRNRVFRKDMDITPEISIGRFLHGPLGSAAAYIVTKEGAKKLLSILKHMNLPYDVALERGWSGFRSFSTNINLIDFCDIGGSTIVKGRETYHNARLPKWKRVGTFFFRLSDYIRRVIYGIKPSGLKCKKVQ